MYCILTPLDDNCPKSVLGESNMNIELGLILFVPYLYSMPTSIPHFMMQRNVLESATIFAFSKSLSLDHWHHMLHPLLIFSLYFGTYHFHSKGTRFILSCIWELLIYSDLHLISNITGNFKGFWIIIPYILINYFQ